MAESTTITKEAVKTFEDSVNREYSIIQSEAAEMRYDFIHDIEKEARYRGGAAKATIGDVTVTAYLDRTGEMKYRVEMPNMDKAQEVESRTMLNSCLEQTSLMEAMKNNKMDDVGILMIPNSNQRIVAVPAELDSAKANAFNDGNTPFYKRYNLYLVDENGAKKQITSKQLEQLVKSKGIDQKYVKQNFATRHEKALKKVEGAFKHVGEKAEKGVDKVLSNAINTGQSMADVSR